MTRVEVTQSFGGQTLTHVLVGDGSDAARPGIVIFPTVVGVSALESQNVALTPPPPPPPHKGEESRLASPENTRDPQGRKAMQRLPKNLDPDGQTKKARLMPGLPDSPFCSLRPRTARGSA